MSWLQRSLNVAARFLAPLSFKGFRHSARLGRISPSGWSLLPGAPALTRTRLSLVRRTRLSGRTMQLFYSRLFQWAAEGIEVGGAIESIDAFVALEEVHDGVREWRGDAFIEHLEQITPKDEADD